MKNFTNLFICTLDYMIHFTWMNNIHITYSKQMHSVSRNIVYVYICLYSVATLKTMLII